MKAKVTVDKDTIGLLADANVRQQARAQHWLDKDVVRNFIRDFHARMSWDRPSRQIEREA